MCSNLYDDGHLNRYEGFTNEIMERLIGNGIDLARLDDLPDAKFRKLVPEAQDSYIIFNQDVIKGFERFYSVVENVAVEPRF
jgi:hypothetical protein